MYMCAQSIFKLHPRFDFAIEGVLKASDSNHVVFTEGNPNVTALFRNRLHSKIGDAFMERVRDTENVPLRTHVELCMVC